MGKNTLCFFGEALVDVYATDVPGDPSAGVQMVGNIGGGVLNASVGAKRWLVSQGETDTGVAFIGGVSGDFFGKRIVNLLDHEGLEYDRCCFSDNSTAIALVGTDENGESSYQFLRTATADISMPASHWQESWFADFSMLCIGTNCMTTSAMADTTHRAVSLAVAAGIPICFDPNIRPALWGGHRERLVPEILSLLPCVSILKLSHTELEMLSREPSEEKRIAALRAIDSEKNINRTLLVTRGEGGCSIYFSDGASQHFQASPVTMVDSTGAGDSFFGTVCAAMAISPLEYWGQVSSAVDGGHLSNIDKQAVLAAVHQGMGVAGQVVQHRGALTYSLKNS